MTTTLTATPNLGTASVLLQVDMTPTDLPITKYELTLANYRAEMANWGGEEGTISSGADGYGYWNSTGANITRVMTGLIVGRKYELSITARSVYAGNVIGFVGGFTHTWISTSPAGSRATIALTATATSHTIYIKPVRSGSSSYYTPIFTSFNFSLLPTAYTGSTFALTRTDANGTRPVRLLPGQRVMDGGLIIEDFEAALVGSVGYAFTSPTGSQTSVITSLVGAKPTIAPAVFPQFGVQDLFITGYDASRGSATVEHAIIGRADPVLRLQPLQSRRGHVTIWCKDYADLVNVVDVYRRGEIVMLRQDTHAGMDFYHAATGVTEGAYDEEFRRWRVDVAFTEVPLPRGPVLGTLGWTWDDLAAAFPTWDDVVEYFGSWNNVQIGIA